MASSSRSLGLPLSTAIRSSQRLLAQRTALPARRHVSSTSSVLRTSPRVPSRRSIHISPPTASVVPVPSPAESSSSEGALTALERRWTGRLPRFDLRADEIDILHEPQQFFQTLLALIGRSRKRITISSLYIGDHEDELIAALHLALSTHPDLTVTFLLDKNRCTRKTWPALSTASLLYPLVRDFGPERARVWFYQSPSVAAKFFPNRFKEGFGTWHSKVYGGDDEVLLTGANLSKDYFTTRQDRYFHFRNAPTLTTYLSSLINLYTQFSYQLLPTSTTTAQNPPTSSSTSKSASPPPPSTSSSSSPAPYTLTWSPTSSSPPKTFQADATTALTTFQSLWASRSPPSPSTSSASAAPSSATETDTTIWPVVQVGYLGVREEEAAMHDIWERVDRMGEVDEGGKAKAKVDLTSGYFALSKGYKEMVLRSKAGVRIVAAAPKANGFYGSKGISGLIPEAYTMLERDFEREARRRGRSGPAGVEVSEWEREGWTYHAKGIWLSPPSSSSPILTLLGSSNLSSRSTNLDAETSFILTTSSPALRSALGDEVARLREYSTPVGEETWKLPERRVGWRVRRIVSPVPRGLGFGDQL